MHWPPPRPKATPGGLLGHWELRRASADRISWCEGINRVKNRAIVFWLQVTDFCVLHWGATTLFVCLFVWHCIHLFFSFQRDFTFHCLFIHITYMIHVIFYIWIWKCFCLFVLNFLLNVFYIIFDVLFFSFDPLFFSFVSINGFLVHFLMFYFSALLYVQILSWPCMYL